MIKLTAPQQAVLIAAAAHPDAIATRPAGTKHAAAAKLAAKLLERRLAREVRARDDAPVWREDEQGRPLSLKLLKAGHTLAAELLSAEPAADRQAVAGGTDAPEAAQPGDTSSGARGDSAPTGPGAVPADAARPVPGAKRTLILALMRREGGATMDELTTATGWLPHTTRAALTGLRKTGIAVGLAKGQRGAASTYRVEAAPVAAAA